MKKIFYSVLISIFNILTLASCSPQEGIYEKEPDINYVPFGKNDNNWRYNKAFSEEFNSNEIYKAWETDFYSWGAWNWDNKNNLELKDGILSLTMRYNPINRDGLQCYFTSAAIRTYSKMTYGYFEIRLKACSLKSGACPAFWLIGDATEGNIRNSEIDILELLQNENSSIIDMNLHTKVIEDGKEIYKRPNNYPELCKNSWTAPWDPRDDFHIYACENRPDSIIFYVDGKPVVKKENLYWHLPMRIYVSMGLRHPFVRYDNGNASIPVKPTEEQIKLFPTTMQVDYVRVWTKEEEDK